MGHGLTRRCPAAALDGSGDPEAAASKEKHTEKKRKWNNFSCGKGGAEVAWFAPLKRSNGADKTTLERTILKQDSALSRW